MRQTLVRCLLEAALHDERIMLLSGDHGYALFDEFRNALPERFLNCGVAEQNMIGVASGLAKAGLRPIVYGLASFIPMRVLEQISSTFVMKIAGRIRRRWRLCTRLELVTSAEDVSALRPLQTIAILSAADRHEIQACSTRSRPRGRRLPSAKVTG